VEVSGDPVPWHLQLWPNAVFVLSGQVSVLATLTLSAKQRPLERQLASIVAAPNSCDLA
jgi:hypothetical protein